MPQTIQLPIKNNTSSLVDKNHIHLENDPIFHIFYSAKITYTLILAQELDLFSFIGESNIGKTFEQICNKCSLQERAAQAILSMCVSLQLLEYTNKNYMLTQISKDYLIPESPYYWGEIINTFIFFPHVYSYQSFKNSTISNQPTTITMGESNIFEAIEKDINVARTITKGMHSKSKKASYFWPKVISLKNVNTMLDVAGGSGVHSIGLVSQWPHINAIVYDRPLVCEVAKEFIQEEGLQNKIVTFVGDIWKDPFPQADIHFYSDVFHDWNKDKCSILAKKSYDYLSTEGYIIIHEILFDDNKNGPMSAALYNLHMLLVTEGQQLSKKELHNILGNAGFKEIKTLPTGFGDWSITIGKKI